MTTILLAIYIAVTNCFMPYFHATISLSGEDYYLAGEANGEKIIMYPVGRTLHNLERAYVHEVGHAIDGGELVPFEERVASDFRDLGRPVYYTDPSVEYYLMSWTDNKTRWREDNFCTEYGKTDPYEDFAECFAMFYFAGDTMLSRPELREKYNFMATVFNRTFATTGNPYPKNTYGL